MDKLRNVTIKRSGGMLTVKGSAHKPGLNGDGSAVKLTKIDRVEIPGDGTAVAYDNDGNAVAMLVITV